MRWTIVRLIWLRELRDQLRDRRTLFMVAILPVLIYPVAGLGVMQLARGFLGQTSTIGVVGYEELIPWDGAPPEHADGPGRAVAALACTTAPVGCPLAGIERASIASALTLGQPGRDYPPLLESVGGKPRVREAYLDPNVKAESFLIERLEVSLPALEDRDAFLAEIDRRPLESRKVDLMLVVPPGFQRRLAETGQPELFLLTREKDEAAKLVNLRVTVILNKWRRDLKKARLARLGLPADFDEPFLIRDPLRDQPTARQDEDSIVNLLVRVFPFVLVMWSLAGALYPAVDLCAGEKERGTMETLLVSPASREEIVWGKFLTIWVFSAATALLNLLSMGLTSWKFIASSEGVGVSPWAIFWGVALILPLSAFFSAVCLAVGAYARSSKEGQYYLMPLFMVTMPLIFLTLAPGVELNPFYSMVPVTGVALLLQKLLAEGANRGAMLYFLPVLAPMVIYSWLALRWAIAQFQREEVLFREAERIDVGLWLRRLFREKDDTPSIGEAFFCFALILGIRWLSLGVGTKLSLLTRTGIAQVAFVATPPLFMALLLTTRPARGLGFRPARWWYWPLALALAALLVPGFVVLVGFIIRQFPGLQEELRLNNPLLAELQRMREDGRSPWPYFLVLAVLPAFCEELAFRGFILSGIRRYFRPWTAVLLSAFLFAVYQMNVFQFIPHFVLGLVLGLLTIRSGSVFPAVLFHLGYNVLLLAPGLLGLIDLDEPTRVPTAGEVALAGGGAVAAGVLLYLLGRRGPGAESA